MAEFCKDCYVRVCGGREDDPVILSDELELCEGCGEYKPVVVCIGQQGLLTRLRQLFGEARRRHPCSRER